MKKEYKKPAFSIRKLEDMTQEEREEYEAVIRQIKEEKNMKKEQLLNKKRKTVNSLEWYVKNVVADEDLKSFSIPQLEKIIDIIKKAEEFRESCDPFYSISANEVVQKSTGKIAYFENSGEIREESKEEVEMGPSSLCYKELMKKLDREKA